MIAWVSPERIVRSTPFRIWMGSASGSDCATLTCRSLISRVLIWLVISTLSCDGAVRRCMSVGRSGTGGRVLLLDGGGRAFAHLLDRDGGDDLLEEAAHHELAGLDLGDAARAQIEQLLVVEPPGRAGMSGTGDLAGLDLQVRHRIGACPVREHQVAVDLVGVGALGVGA